MKYPKLYEIKITDANILRVAVGTTGERGGDTGHGCCTVIEIEDIRNTDIKVEQIANKQNGGFRITLGGDAELRSIIEAFEFVSKTLKAHQHDKA